jgi:hypothetical protein
MSPLNPESRQILLTEIEKWRQDGLISPATADLLRQRYQPPAPPKPVEAHSAKPAIPPAPPAPKPTLAQTLLSEASIKVFLYLGAFFVIAAALISAALVEILRFPILLLVAFLFGAGALALKKRLPQPSFILWVVFSALLPISAGVLVSLARLQGLGIPLFWTSVWAGMALAWAFSTWLYRSRFFSLAAFGALAVSAWQFANIFVQETNVYLLALTLASILGAAGAYALKKWMDAKFALPLFIAIQLFELAVLFIAFVAVWVNLFQYFETAWWLFAALTWLAAAIFYAASDLVFPFKPFPYLAAGSLTPIAWLTASEFAPPQLVYALAWGVWAASLAIIGEIARFLPWEKVRQYSPALTLASLPLFFVSGGIAWFENEGPWLGFGLFAASALLLTALQLFKSRWWVWTAGAAAWSLTYLSFFGLPPILELEINGFYIASGWMLLLCLPDLLPPGKFNDLPAWRWPLRCFTLLVAASTTIAGAVEVSLPPSLAYGLLALLCLAYALRFLKPWFLSAFQAYLALASWYLLDFYQVEAWLPLMTGLFSACYLTGMGTAWRKADHSWARALRWPALFLGLLLIPLCPFYEGPARPWAMTAIGFLFILETFTRQAWMEIIIHLVFGAALAYLLAGEKASGFGLYALVYSILWLGLDALLHFLLDTRIKMLRWLPWVAGGTAALIGNAALFLEWRDASAWTIGYSLAYSALFLGLALAYRGGITAYAFHAVFAVAALNLIGLTGFENWSLPLVGLAMLYYGLGLLDSPRGWTGIRRASGLALATLVSLALLTGETSLWDILPAALTGTLWAIEALRRKNVWLGFPANSFYLLSYFILLFNLDVREPQFFSIGAALLGIFMHYLLVRTGKNTGAFLTGMVSQLVLLGTTYIQMAAEISLGFFAALFFQSLIVLFYGLVIQSRSLVFTPIAFVVLGVITVIFSVLQGIATLIMVGCTGILMILAGIAAVLLRERLSDLRGRFDDWRS